MKIIQQGKKKFSLNFAVNRCLVNNNDIMNDWKSIANFIKCFCFWISFISRKLAIEILKIKDPDFYEWEAHIFFDDCMEPDESRNEFQVRRASYFKSCNIFESSIGIL